MSVEHYIFTRFNLGYRETADDPDEWLERRVELFETYTLPSMLRQTVSTWTWLLAFDESTPASVLCKYDYIDNVRVIFERPDHWVRRNVDDRKVLITTRLDNDDYVEKDWIEGIRQSALGLIHDGEMLPFVLDCNGRALDVATETYYDPKRKRCNSMFLSLVEHGKDCRTCYARQHTLMPDVFPSYRMDWYGWVMVCHGDNIANQIHPHFTVHPNQDYYVNG